MNWRIKEACERDSSELVNEKDTIGIKYIAFDAEQLTISLRLDRAISWTHANASAILFP